MDELLSEKEQLDIIRSWWKDNGTYVIAGIVLGVGGIFGFNQWRSSQVEVQIGASTLFEELAEEIAENRVEPAETLAAGMYSDYPETIYADQARLAMARLYMDQGRDQDAAAALTALIDGDGDTGMRLVARLRLAKILLYQGKPEDVLTLLEGYTDSGMGARFSVAVGDAHYELGRFQEAEAAYMAALEDPRSAQLIDATLVRMKLNDLPEVLPEGESATPADGAATEPEPADAAAEPEQADGTAELEQADAAVEPEAADAPAAEAEEPIG